MPEIVHWKCDFPNCGAISPLHQGMPVGWFKLTMQAPLLEPVSAFLCPKHDEVVKVLGDLEVSRT